MENLLNERQAARLLGIAAVTLRNWRRAGKGPKVARFGRTVRYTSQSLEEFVQAKQEGR